jgi:ribosomal protein L40E
MSAQLIEDEEKLAQATAGPDQHCPYCNARNPASATICPQCGGDLSEAAIRAKGQVLGALNTDADATLACRVCGAENPASAFTCGSCGAPLKAPDVAPTPQPKAAPESKTGCSLLGIGAVLVAILLLIGGLIYFFGTSADTFTATAAEAQWSRSIEIEGLTPVTHEAWREEIPVGVTVLACREEVQRTVQEPVAGAPEVCGTPYVIDEGSGFGEAVQDCEYEILADFCSYEVLEWRKTDDIQVTGIGQELYWPEIIVDDSQREGNRSQVLRCIFDVDGRSYSYTMSTLDQFTTCTPGSRWQLEINRAGGIMSAHRQ